MAQAGKGELNFRCPQCFKRDLDIDMFYIKEKKEYYCIRCCFHGSKERVEQLNEEIKDRYGFLKFRVESFGEDNRPLVMKPHKAGDQ